VDELTLLGDLTLVPVIIAFTQMLKKVTPTWNSDLTAFLIAIPLCLGHSLYDLKDLTVFYTFLGAFHFIINCVITGVATAFTAGKAYDLAYGDKQLAKQKQVLHEKIAILETSIPTEVPDAEATKQAEQDKKLAEILGR